MNVRLFVCELFDYLLVQLCYHSVIEVCSDPALLTWGAYILAEKHLFNQVTDTGVT